MKTTRFLAPASILIAFTLFACGLADSHSPSKRSTIFINCGEDFGNGSRSDKGYFKGRKTDYYSTEHNISTPSFWKQAWVDSLKSHRYAYHGDLEYAIPVEGAYNISLFFAETWIGAEAPGTRQFTISINGDPTTYGGNKKEILMLDVVQMAGGMYKAFALQSAAAAESANGSIRITLGRVKAKNHPMISAIRLTPFPPVRDVVSHLPRPELSNYTTSDYMSSPTAVPVPPQAVDMSPSASPSPDHSLHSPLPVGSPSDDSHHASLSPSPSHVHSQD